MCLCYFFKLNLPYVLHYFEHFGNDLKYSVTFINDSNLKLNLLIYFCFLIYFNKNHGLFILFIFYNEFNILKC